MIIWDMSNVSCGSADSNMSELFTIRKALQILSLKVELHNVNVIIESDSSNAVSWVSNSEVNYPWEFHYVQSLIDNLKATLHNVSFVHTMRENNFMADTLAKQGVYRDCDFIAWL